MRGEHELVELANENFVASFRKLAEHRGGGEHRRLGGAFAFVTDLPFSFFNGCVVVEPSAPADVEDALAWVAGRGVPMRLFVAHGLERGLETVAAAHGLERDPVPYPAMALHPIPVRPAAAAGVEVIQVDAHALDEFRGIGTASGIEAALAERLYRDSFLLDPDVQAFIVRLEGRPVGYSLAIRSHRTSGVYNVGTVPEARRRGVGTAATWAAIDVARRAGLDCVVLQSSEMGLSMYEAMGFRTVLRYAVFREPVTPTGQETPVPPSPQ